MFLENDVSTMTVPASARSCFPFPIFSSPHFFFLSFFLSFLFPYFPLSILGSFSLSSGNANG